MRIVKKYYLLVDGYNIINFWDELRSISIISLDEARQSLVDMMAELGSITGETIIVVFDSYLQKNPTRQIIETKGIEVVFTKEYETADNYIEMLVSNSKKHEIFKVASSDSMIQSMIFGKGANRVSANELKYYYEYNKELAIKQRKLKEKKKDTNIVSLNNRSLDALDALEELLNGGKSEK